MKKKVMIALDERVHEKVKELRLNVSRVCEDALLKEIENAKPKL